MNRRTALKNMGLTLGCLVASPNLLNLLQASTRENLKEWTPVFFSPEEGLILMRLADLILPKTDTPSATEVGVHRFLDNYVNEVSDEPEQRFMKMGLEKLIHQALRQSAKKTSDDLNDHDLEPVLAASLKQRDPVEEKTLFDSLRAYKQDIANGIPAELDDEIACYVFAHQFRDSVIWAYRTSEIVGEQVLAYLPSPGEYIGCGDLDELTGGKAWSF